MAVQLFWRREAAASLRREVCPPLRRASLSSRLRGWLEVHRDPDATQSPRDDAQPKTPARRNLDPVLRVQRDFARELADIPTPQAGIVLAAVWRARNLHDLWHQRVPLFDSVARHLDQQQAETRLARLNRHFPTRSPRSGLAPFITSFGGLDR
jgi:hypothetical protein